MRVTALASGSGGNALLVHHEDEALLIDCGLPLRTLEGLLRDQGLVPAQIRAVLLTHEHRDHSLGIAAMTRRYRTRVVCNRATGEALGVELAGMVEELPTGQAAVIGPFTIQSFPVAHDAADPVGFRISAGGAVVAIAVDLGSWDESTVMSLRGADLLVVEANHDRGWLRASPYPPVVQQRIGGAYGHLDNEQCGALLAQVCIGRSCDVWLAHLSSQANAPRQAITTVRRILKLAGVADTRIVALPQQARPGKGGTAVWRAEERRMMQQRLFEW